MVSKKRTLPDTTPIPFPKKLKLFVSPKADPRHPKNLAYLAAKAMRKDTAYKTMFRAYKDAVEEHRGIPCGSDVDEVESEPNEWTSGEDLMNPLPTNMKPRTYTGPPRSVT